MQYKVCPHCGAHLDCDEKCDCEKEKEADPLQRVQPLGPIGGKWGANDSSLSAIPGAVNADLRTLFSGISPRDIVDSVRKVFPSFDKTTLSKCKNPAKYGVVLHPDGLAALAADHKIPIDTMAHSGPAPPGQRGRATGTASEIGYAAALRTPPLRPCGPISRRTASRMFRAGWPPWCRITWKGRPPNETLRHPRPPHHRGFGAHRPPSRQRASGPALPGVRR